MGKSTINSHFQQLCQFTRGYHTFFIIDSREFKRIHQSLRVTIHTIWSPTHQKSRPFSPYKPTMALPFPQSCFRLRNSGEWFSSPDWWPLDLARRTFLPKKVSLKKVGSYEHNDELLFYMFLNFYLFGDCQYRKILSKSHSFFSELVNILDMCRVHASNKGVYC